MEEPRKEVDLRLYRIGLECYQGDWPAFVEVAVYLDDEVNTIAHLYPTEAQLFYEAGEEEGFKVAPGVHIRIRLAPEDIKILAAQAEVYQQERKAKGQ